MECWKKEMCVWFQRANCLSNSNRFPSLSKMSDAITMFLQSKKNSNFRPSYLRSLKQYLTAFARGREDVPPSIRMGVKKRAMVIHRGRTQSPSGNLFRLHSIALKIKLSATPHHPNTGAPMVRQPVPRDNSQARFPADRR